MIKYTDEHIEYIKKIAPNRTNEEIARLFSKKYFAITTEKMRSLKKRYKIYAFGRIPYRWEKGATPFNKGLRGVNGFSKTRFKKGQVPHNTQEIGSERIIKDGYTEVKIAHPNVWELKQRLIWQKANGDIPKGNVIIFLDNNRQNLDINNLSMVTRRELVIMNKRGLTTKDNELTKAGITTARIIIKINEINKQQTEKETK